MCYINGQLVRCNFYTQPKEVIMSKKSKTMEEIVLGLNITQNPGSVNKPLEIEKCNLARALKLIVDYKYQRLISPLKLQDYGILDYNLLVPVVVSRRPISLGEALSGERVIDGQNKVAKFILSQENEGLTLAILDHDEDATYEDVLKKEALVFNRLNTWRNKLSTIDVLRSGVCFNDPDACHVENTMKTLNVVAYPDTFGSDCDDATPVKSFAHFHYTIRDDYPKNATGTLGILEGYKLWRRIYGRNEENSFTKIVAASNIHGTAFRAICLLNLFINDGLTNGRQEKFQQWCIARIPFVWNQDKLIKGFSGFQSPQWILHRIIDKYNEEIGVSGKGSQTLGPKTLADAARVNSKFSHPDEDAWKRILFQAG